MSMKDERLLILKMVEDGKITADEATKLLHSLAATCECGSGINFEEKFNKFGENMQNFAKEVTCKVNEMYKTAEPKIRDFTKTVVTKTADIADNISASLHDKAKDMGCCGEASEAADEDDRSN